MYHHQIVIAEIQLVTYKILIARIEIDAVV